MDKSIRLKQHFTDERSYNNLINIYKELRGKENLHLRMFLKAIVICCLNAQEENKTTSYIKWQSIDSYFSPNGMYPPYYSDKFDMEALKEKHKRAMRTNWKAQFFGQLPINYMKTLL